MQNATCYDAAPTSAWKNALMNTSALAAGMYYNTAYASKGSAGATYYQTAYAGSTAVKSSNHCVTIIGWDDNYSRLNFPSSHRPKSDGAWLVANSYGSKTDENGYFWLSYEEPSICDVYAFELEKIQSTIQIINTMVLDGAVRSQILQVRKGLISFVSVQITTKALRL